MQARTALRTRGSSRSYPRRWAIPPTMWAWTRARPETLAGTVTVIARSPPRLVTKPWAPASETWLSTSSSIALAWSRRACSSRASAASAAPRIGPTRRRPGRMPAGRSRWRCTGPWLSAIGADELRGDAHRLHPHSVPRLDLRRHPLHCTEADGRRPGCDETGRDGRDARRAAASRGCSRIRGQRREDLVAVGADLEPGTLLEAYRRGCSRCRLPTEAAHRVVLARGAGGAALRSDCG